MIDEITRDDVLDFARSEIRDPHFHDAAGWSRWLQRLAKVALEQETELKQLRKPPAFNSTSAIIPTSEIPSIETIVREHVWRVLDALGGNKTRAARILGISRRSLYRWVARMAEPPAGGPDARQVGLR